MTYGTDARRSKVGLNTHSDRHAAWRGAEDTEGDGRQEMEDRVANSIDRRGAAVASVQRHYSCWIG